MMYIYNYIVYKYIYIYIYIQLNDIYVFPISFIPSILTIFYCFFYLFYYTLLMHRKKYMCVHIQITCTLHIFYCAVHIIFSPC